MGKTGRRRRGGWRRKGRALQAYVRLHAGRGGLRTRVYPLGTSPTAMQAWIDDTAGEYRRRHPRGAVGTLARDAETYLKLLVDRPRLQQNRTTQLAWWCDRFGPRSRWSLEPHELETALRELTAAGAAASTVKKYRTALYHLFTKLDGKNQPNPLRDVAPPREPDAVPRALPFAIIDALFDAMPDHRYARTLTAEAVTDIRRRARAPTVNLSALARAHHVSETMVRKIVAGRPVHSREAPSKTKARLQVMAYVGLPPAQIRTLEPSDVDWTAPSALVHGRKKGGGTRAVRLPLTPHGLAALQAFAAADAWGQFSMSAVDRMFKRAIGRLCTTLEEEPATREAGAQMRRDLATATPYALRHSHLTEAQLATGNIRATQGLAMHSDIRQTLRYTLAAVAPELQAAADALTARMAGQRPGDQPRPRASTIDDFRPKSRRAKTVKARLRSERNRRKA